MNRKRLIEALKKQEKYVGRMNVRVLSASRIERVADERRPLVRVVAVTARGSLAYVLPGECPETATIVNRRELTAACEAVGGDEVSLTAAGEGRIAVTSRSGGGTATVGTLDAEDWPDPTAGLDRTVFPRTVTVDGAAFAAALKSALACASEDATRPYINGIHVTAKKNAAVAVEATDGHRLLRVEMEALIAEHERIDAIVPLDAARVLACELKAAPHTVLSILGGHYLSVAWGGGISYKLNEGGLWARLNDTDFPPTEQVIPRGPFDVEVTVDRRALAVAAAAAGKALGGERGSHAPLILAIRSDTIEVGRAAQVEMLVRATRFGETLAERTVPARVVVRERRAKDWEDGEYRLGLQPAYLVDAAEALRGETVTLGITDPASGVAIREDDRVVVIMPVRL